MSVCLITLLPMNLKHHQQQVGYQKKHRIVTFFHDDSVSRRPFIGYTPCCHVVAKSCKLLFTAILFSATCNNYYIIFATVFPLASLTVLYYLLQDIKNTHFFCL